MAEKMKINLQDLWAQKEALKRRIRINETGNDSYYLSQLYKTHQAQMQAINKQIDALTKTSDFSTETKL